MDRNKIVLRSLEEEFQTMEQVTDASNKARDEVTALLKDAVSKISFNEADVRDKDATKAMLSIISAYTSTIKDKETSVFKSASAKTRLKESNDAATSEEAIVRLLRQVTTGGEETPPEIETVDEIDLDISPDLEDTILDGELREDPDDLTF